MKITRILDFTLTAAFCAGCVWSAAAGIPGVRRTKVVGMGWDLRMATPQELLDHAGEFDRSGLDGAVVALAGQRGDGMDGALYNSRYVPTQSPYSREMLLPHKDALCAFQRHRGLKESLVLTHFTPTSRLDWRDDGAWARFAGNAAVIAAFARECGLKGLFDDNEDYKKSRQWRHASETDGGDYDELRALAVRRGMEVGKAMFDAFPDMAFVSTYHLSEELDYFTASDPAARMREKGDLWPAFFEGIVRAAPETAKLVDGDEHCYFCDAGRNDFYVHFWNLHQAALPLLSPDVRSRYLSRLVVGGGIYLDMYTCDEPGKTCWYAPPAADGTRISRLAANIAQGARVTGDYLWIYGEKGWTIPWKPGSRVASSERLGKFKPWEEQLPGLADAIRAQTDPSGFAAETLRRNQGNLAAGKWGSWQRRESNGEFVEKDGVLSARGVKHGCFTLAVRGIPGHVYAIEGLVKGRGGISVSWRAKGERLGECPGFSLPLGVPGVDVWRRGVHAFVMPPDADEIFVMPRVSGQKEDEETLFAGIRIVEAERPAGAGDVKSISK